MVGTPTRVIIDTDPGIDDTAAILMALGSPELQVEALTTVFGNTPVEQCTINALRILEAAQRVDAARLTALWVERVTGQGG